MGNSGSGQGTVDEPIPSPIVGGGPGRIKSKVLPDLTPALRLRQTDNGAILHNGGTISTRKQDRQKQSFDDSHHIEIKRDFYGSEPDLRYQGRLSNFNNESPSKMRFSKSRKKYKAPTVPNNNNIPGDSSSPDSFQEWENSMGGQPSRRLRLFKTRAETRKKIAEHNLHSLQSYLPAAGTLQRSLSTPQFHAELLEAAEKLRPVREPPVGKSNDTPSISPVGCYQSLDSGKERLNNYGRNYEGNSYDVDPFQHARNQRNKMEGRDSPSHEIWQTQPAKVQAPVKRFYFGMNANNEINESSALDKFAEKLHHLSHTPMESSSSQDSPEIFDDILSNENKAGISVQLRATLPRKQLDIPRFSPTTAWRLLSNIDSPPPPSEEDDLVQFEHRLLAPPLPVHVPVQMDKSADSGISGDASPQHHDSTHNSQVAWTPQQDLEETSSDGGFPCQPLSSDQCSAAKYSPRFTLSLPRDDRIKLYGSSDKSDGGGQSSIDNKKMRRSGSGVFGKSGLDKEDNVGDDAPLLDSNWVLSRSVPNSLNYANVSLSRWNENSPDVPDLEGDLTSSLIKQPSFSYLQTGGHIMYLPEYTKPRDHRVNGSYSISHPVMSKSCEDLSRGMIDDPVSLNNSESLEPPKVKKGKKFTFQSTVRQIERKRLAEKLSKQVEHKEKERKSELEAMRKVEEEFQRKREREKADIRQQLRLFTITQNSKNNLQDLPTTQVLSEFRQQQREYKEYRPQRRPLSEMESMHGNEPNPKRATVHPKIVCQIPKSTQVYVTPRLSGSSDQDCSDQILTQTPTSDNYRKNFAQGGLPNSLTSSESEKTGSPRNRDIMSSWQKENRYTRDEEESIISIERPKISLGITETKTIIIPQDRNTLGIFKKDVEESFNSEQLVPSNPLLGVSALQPFVRGKTYKPISFNPSRNQVAQFAN